MGLLTQAITTLALCGAPVVLYTIWEFIVRPMLSPINKLRGPVNQSFLFGNSMEVHIGDALPAWRRWAKEFGPTYLGLGPLGVRISPFRGL